LAQSWNKEGALIDGRNRARTCEIAGIEPATVLFEGDDTRAYIIASNIARRHMSKGQQAMAVAMVYPEPEKTTHGKKSKTKLLLETKTNFSDARLSQARTVLAHSTDLARAVLAGASGFPERQTFGRSTGVAVTPVRASFGRSCRDLRPYPCSPRGKSGRQLLTELFRAYR
jgi:hypothetical protein